MVGGTAPATVQGIHYPGWRRLLDFARFDLDRKLWRPRVRFETIGGERLKRVRFFSAEAAATQERRFARFGPTPHFPTVVGRFGPEMLVEFVHGPVAKRGDRQVVEEVADFYAALYSRDPWQSSAMPSELLQRLEQDLGLLRDGGVLQPAEAKQLLRLGETRAPAQLWVGFDYSDPVPKNFVRRPGKPLCAVDIESLRCDRPLGFGVAKACARWLEPFRTELLDRMAAQDAPDFQAYFPFIELCFLVQWTGNNVRKKAWRPVARERFAELLAA